MSIRKLAIAAATAAGIAGACAPAQAADYKLWVRNEGPTMVGIVVLGGGGTYLRTGICLVPKEKRQISTNNAGAYSVKIRIETKRTTSNCARDQTINNVTSDFFNLRSDGRTMFTVWSNRSGSKPTFSVGVN